jgi:hypothetical protein
VAELLGPWNTLHYHLSSLETGVKYAKGIDEELKLNPESKKKIIIPGMNFDRRSYSKSMVVRSLYSSLAGHVSHKRTIQCKVFLRIRMTSRFV